MYNGWITLTLRCQVADKKKQKRYTKEFKIEAVKLVTEKGMKAFDVARYLGISQLALGSWIKD
jgi:transposase